jgi:peptidoglycan/LPS O-acetylase OafA/YrhL
LAPVANGDLAVSFFFLLSGFVLAHRYGGAANHMATGRREYFVARFARIYPLFFVGFLLDAPFILAHRFAADPLPLALGKSAAEAGVNLAMLQAWLPMAGGAWNFPSWSLSAEAFFYLLFPFLLERLPQRFSRQILLVLTCVASLGALMTVRQTLGLPVAFAFNPLVCLPEFYLGILVHRLSTASARRRPTTALLVACGVLWAGLASGVLTDATRIMASMVVSAIVVWQLATPFPSARWLTVRPLVELGKASYALYILHIPLAHIWESALGFQPGASLPALLAYLVTLCACSWIAFRFVEEPARRWLTKTLGPRATPSSPAREHLSAG